MLKRKTIRNVHLIAAILTGVAIYGPWIPTTILQYGIFPTLAVTGLILFRP
ncbi:hypothetical protein [Thaumasiovibrio sp. DFM-14]|uniref:hypothetical protein n=1 Tax=Thaumasiovibrio sp. DFM-14 TaxID=3384792 RepID=UPI0039A3757D